MNYTLLRNLIEKADYISKGRGKDNKYDCWGWVVKLSKELFNIDLISYHEDYVHSMDKSVCELIIKEAEKYKKVELGKEKEGDLISLKIKGEPFHIAIVIKKGLMSHISSKVNACVEQYNTPLWKERIDGIYRP